MNSLKNLLFLAILAVVAWGVYYSLNHRESAGPPPPGAENAVPIAPLVEMGDSGHRRRTASFPGHGAGCAGGAECRRLPPAAPPAAPPAVLPAAPPFVPPAPAKQPTAPPVAPPATPPPAPAPVAVAVPTAPPPVAPITPTVVTPALAKPPAVPAPIATGTPPAVAPLPPDNRDKAESYMAVWSKAHAKLDEGHLAEAHRLLSSLYHNPTVPPEEVRSVNGLLDQLAGAVIYSRLNLLERPWIVQTGDTLKIIADAYGVPPQLLARINGVRDFEGLRPGRELKVVRGPFNAVVSLKNYELTLMLKDRYAGRFAIGIGGEHPPQEGSYIVRDKRELPLAGMAGGALPMDPITGTPVDGFRIDLGNGISIHNLDGAADWQNRRAGLDPPQPARHRQRLRHPLARIEGDDPAIGLGLAGRRRLASRETASEPPRPFIFHRSSFRLHPSSFRRPPRRAVDAAGVAT